MFLNQEINPTTTSNPESKSKSRLNIKYIKPAMTSNPESKSKPSNDIFLYLKSKHNKFQSQSYKFCTSICPNLPFHPQIKTTMAKH